MEQLAEKNKHQEQEQQRQHRQQQEQQQELRQGRPEWQRHAMNDDIISQGGHEGGHQGPGTGVPWGARHLLPSDANLFKELFDPLVTQDHFLARTFGHVLGMASQANPENKLLRVTFML